MYFVAIYFLLLGKLKNLIKVFISCFSFFIKIFHAILIIIFSKIYKWTFFKTFDKFLRKIVKVKKLKKS